MIELVSTGMIATVCMECKKVIKYTPAGYQVPVGAASHGYCERCLPIVESRWFSGRKA